ncbi:hypothetical protein ACHAWC_001710 [Mediolabrus comicus]
MLSLTVDLLTAYIVATSSLSISLTTVNVMHSFEMRAARWRALFFFSSKASNPKRSKKEEASNTRTLPLLRFKVLDSVPCALMVKDAAFIGGKLNFKGDGKKKKSKKSKKSKHGVGDEDVKAKKDERKYEKQQHDSSDDEDLTAAEKRSKSFKQKQERKELEKIASMSHRERVENFNTKLSELTELNDIPRVSAAGNG